MSEFNVGDRVRCTLEPVVYDRVGIVDEKWEKGCMVKFAGIDGRRFLLNEFIMPDVPNPVLADLTRRVEQLERVAHGHKAEECGPKEFSVGDRVRYVSGSQCWIGRLGTVIAIVPFPECPFRILLDGDTLDFGVSADCIVKVDAADEELETLREQLASSQASLKAEKNLRALEVGVKVTVDAPASSYHGQEGVVVKGEPAAHGGWYRLEFSDAKSQWFHRKYIRAAGDPPRARPLVWSHDEALSYAWSRVHAKEDMAVNISIVASAKIDRLEKQVDEARDLLQSIVNMDAIEMRRGKDGTIIVSASVDWIERAIRFIKEHKDVRGEGTDVFAVRTRVLV